MHLLNSIDGLVMTSPDQRPTFCSQQARASNEPLFGTGAEVSSWLLLEVPRPWGAKAVAESDLPEAVRERLLAWKKETPRARIQLIRKEVGTKQEAGFLQCYAATVTPAGTALYHARLTEYGEVHALDLAFIADGQAPSGDRWAPSDERLVLTCVNGKRDRCCAKWGRPVHRAFEKAAGVSAWQTTHLGGHRFAPTTLVLPEGIHYGWLSPDEAAPLMEAHRHGRIYRLDRLRGEVMFDRPVQAAAYFLRRETGNLTVGGVRIVEAVQNEARWTITLAIEGARYRVALAVESVTVAYPKSCGDTPGGSIPQLRLEDIDAV